VIFTTFLLASLAARMQLDRAGQPHSADWGYSVFAYGNDERCLYMLTHVGLDISELARALTGGYDYTRGMDVLTTSNTPRRCVKEAKRIAYKVGFKKVRVRLEADTSNTARLP